MLFIDMNRPEDPWNFIFILILASALMWETWQMWKENLQYCVEVSVPIQDPNIRAAFEDFTNIMRRSWINFSEQHIVHQSSLHITLVKVRLSPQELER